MVADKRKFKVWINKWQEKKYKILYYIRYTIFFVCMWQGQSLRVGVVEQLGQYPVPCPPFPIHIPIFVSVFVSVHLLLNSIHIPHPPSLSVDSGLASSPIATWPRVYMRSSHKVTPTNALYSLQKSRLDGEYGWAKPSICQLLTKVPHAKFLMKRRIENGKSWIYD